MNKNAIQTGLYNFMMERRGCFIIRIETKSSKIDQGISSETKLGCYRPPRLTFTILCAAESQSGKRMASISPEESRQQTINSLMLVSSDFLRCIIVVSQLRKIGKRELLRESQEWFVATKLSSSQTQGVSQGSRNVNWHCISNLTIPAQRTSNNPTNELKLSSYVISGAIKNQKTF